MTFIKIKNIVIRFRFYLYAMLLAFFCAFFITSVIRYIITEPVPISFTKDSSREFNFVSHIDVEKNIFNTHEKMEADSPVVFVPNEISSSGFNGKVTGVIIGSDYDDIRAILVKDGNIYILIKGIENNGLLLKNADISSVIISHNGVDYNIMLDAGGTIEDYPVSATSSSNISNAVENIVLKKSEVGAAVKDITTLFKGIDVSYFYDNGVFKGYRITRIDRNSPIMTLGINRGDIITRINGEEIKTPEVLFRTLNGLADVNALTVDILRNNNKKTLFIELQ